MWGEPVHTAVYLKNTSPTSAIEHGITPLQLFTGEIPKLTTVIPLGVRGYKHILKEVRTNWEPNSVPGVFTGYTRTNQFRILINCKIQITRDFDLTKVISRTTTIDTAGQLVPVSFDVSTTNNTPMSAAPIDKPRPRTPDPPEPAEDLPISHTPHRTHTPGAFPPDTIEEAIHVRLPEPPAKEELYSQKSRRVTTGKRISSWFEDDYFKTSCIAIQNPNPTSTKCDAYYTTSTTEPESYSEAISSDNKAM